jgi:hypothetical protein
MGSGPFLAHQQSVPGRPGVLLAATLPIRRLRIRDHQVGVLPDAFTGAAGGELRMAICEMIPPSHLAKCPGQRNLLYFATGDGCA